MEGKNDVKSNYDGTVFSFSPYQGESLIYFPEHCTNIMFGFRIFLFFLLESGECFEKKKVKPVRSQHQQQQPTHNAHTNYKECCWLL